MKHSHIDIPEHMKRLPLTDKGYLKPWFVKDDDFRIVDGKKAGLAVTKRACWICGQPFETKRYALVGDPLSAMFRICKEPPCHVDCAQYAMQVCPFILYPHAKRRSAGLAPEQLLEHTNRERKVKIPDENPGEYYLTIVSDFTYHHKLQVMSFSEGQIIERQHWIEGIRQQGHPEPIVPLDQIPENYRRHIKLS